MGDARRMKVACIQMRSSTDVCGNLEALKKLVAEAVSQGAQYVQSPEMTSIVEKNRSNLFSKIERDEQPQTVNPVVSFASELAKKHQIWLHVGSIAVALENGMAANRGLLFSPSGERIAKYDKIHMFDVDLPKGETWRESAVYKAGQETCVVDTGEYNLGMSICYDLRFPQLYRQQAKAGADILTCPAAFTQQTGLAHWHVLLRARAIENGAFVIAAAQGGLHEDGRHTFGHSLIVNPWGEIIDELDSDEPGVLVCEIDLDAVGQARIRIPNLASDARYSLTTHRIN